MQAVRDLALDADPRIEESIKWSTPTFSYKGNIFSFNPGSSSLLFTGGAKIPGDHAGLEGDGEAARVMRFADLDEVREVRRVVLKAWCRWKVAITCRCRKDARQHR
jgi:hypothetical protein